MCPGPSERLGHHGREYSRLKEANCKGPCAKASGTEGVIEGPGHDPDKRFAPASFRH
jgi:hypothetical protein